MKRMAHSLFSAILFAATLAVTGCTYREIRPSIAIQEAERADIIRFAGLSFQQLAPTVWQHTSYLDLPGFGAVPSNGLIVVHGDTSILVDTGWTASQTDVIIAWAASELNRPIRAAVITHAHSDAMGGIDALHSAGVATYAHPMTNRIAPDKQLTPAQNKLIFDGDGWARNPEDMSLAPLRLYYPGPGHTTDNITVGVMGTSVAFAGGLIKGSDAKSLGNLKDANTDYYAQAVRNFETAFPDASVIAMSNSTAEDRDAIERTLKLAKEL
ncbi:subclass B1 metallo-beta-lactamase [Altererythrobacter aestiaquae]|uniref:beta-lactamase n=2 Tax=Pontixanthobacter aestiaquae TaxID=1509367 RepID=A0A844Z5C4_9SPHN|nr:subclass B1 metallo-beta-lactamase [Pontixanthobacter aestiaquae]MXO83861.1 subclass B1 metallo-beta-lactamase [Pontixanthobacter aestiaquae]